MPVESDCGTIVGEFKNFMIQLNFRPKFVGSYVMGLISRYGSLSTDLKGKRVYDHVPPLSTVNYVVAVTWVDRKSVV